MKRSIQISLAISGIAALAGTLFLSRSGGGYNFLMPMASGNSANTVWGHYSSVDATQDSFGCKEFWISCSTHEVVFDAPTTGKIENRGTPNIEDIISWKSLEDGRVVKKLNSIVGLASNYSTSCGTLPDLSGVSAFDGTVYFEIYDESSDLVETSQISNGNTYTLKAKVDETDDYGYAEASSTLLVNSHDASTTIEYPDNYIGNKSIKCSKCSETIGLLPMTQSDLSLSDLNKFAFDRYFESDCGGYSTIGEKLKSNYPEYSGGNSETGEGMYHIWSGSEQESSSTIKMPRVDFSAFNSVAFVLHVNTSWMKIGFGLGESDNLMPFVQRSGGAMSFVINCVYDKTNSVLNCLMNASNLECAKFEITDEDVIKGVSGIALKTYYGSWASVILDSILLNHECGTMTSISKSAANLITADKICQTCNRLSSISNNDYVYGISDFASNKYGLTISGSNLNVGTCSEDVGAIRLGGDQSTVTEGIITLPRANYKNVRNVMYTFSCNAGNSVIGFDTTNRISTLSNTKTNNKSKVILHYENNKLYGALITGSGSEITTEISDGSIIEGCEGLKLYVKLAAYNFISISKFTINASSGYDGSLNNELSISNFGGTWSAFGEGKWYHEIPDENDHDLTLPKVNFNYCKELIILGSFHQGSKIGFTSDSLIYNSSGGGVWEYFVMKLTAIDDGKLKGQCFIYSKCDAAGSKIHGDQLTRLSYLGFNTLVTSSEVIINNKNIYDGKENCHGLASRRLSWNPHYEIAVADLILK